jgi:hypothetical protein
VRSNPARYRAFDNYNIFGTLDIFVSEGQDVTYSRVFLRFPVILLPSTIPLVKTASSPPLNDCFNLRTLLTKKENIYIGLEICL